VTFRIDRRPPVGTKEVEAFVRIYEKSFALEQRDDTRELLTGLIDGELLCVLALIDDAVVGFAIVLPLDDLHIGFLEYLAVDPEHRNQHFGSLLLEYLRGAVDPAKSMVGLLWEVEPPAEHQGGEGTEDQLRRQRIAFYERNGAVVVDGALLYRAPASTGSGTIPFWLMWLPLGSRDDPVPPTGELLPCYVTGILVRGYGLEEEDPLVRDVISDLAC
jgi:GNAT superfamily N-acetyltransferase